MILANQLVSDAVLAHTVVVAGFAPRLATQSARADAVLLQVTVSAGVEAAAPHAVGQLTLAVAQAYDTNGAGTMSALRIVSATPPLADAEISTSGTSWMHSRSWPQPP